MDVKTTDTMGLAHSVAREFYVRDVAVLPASIGFYHIGSELLGYHPGSIAAYRVERRFEHRV